VLVVLVVPVVRGGEVVSVGLVVRVVPVVPVVSINAPSTLQPQTTRPLTRQGNNRMS